MCIRDRFQRTRSLIGAEALQRLHDAKVLVFGVGGVGGYVCEALVRAGVGQIDIVDKDVVDITKDVYKRQFTCLVTISIRI